MRHPRGSLSSIPSSDRHRAALLNHAVDGSLYGMLVSLFIYAATRPILFSPGGDYLIFGNVSATSLIWTLFLGCLFGLFISGIVANLAASPGQLTLNHQARSRIFLSYTLLLIPLAATLLPAPHKNVAFLGLVQIPWLVLGVSMLFRVARLLPAMAHLRRLSHSLPHPTLFAGTAGIALFVSLLIYSGVALKKWDPAGDEGDYLLMTKSLVQDRDIDLANNMRAKHFTEFGLVTWIVHSLNSESERGLFSSHRPGLAFILAPGYALAKRKGIIVVMVLLTVGTAVAVWQTSRLIGTGRIPATIAALSCVLTPPGLIYAFKIYPEMAAALVVSFLALELIRSNPGAGRLALASLGIAFLPWLGERYVILAAGFWVALLWRGPRRVWAHISLPILAVSIILLAAYSRLLYGQLWFPYVHSPLSVHVFLENGLPALMVDSSHGLLALSPIFVVSLTALLRIRRFGTPLALNCLIGLAYLVLVACYGDWRAGYTPAGRYLIPVIPIFGLLVAIGAEQWKEHKIFPVVIALLVLSLWLGNYGLHHPDRFTRPVSPYMEVSPALNLAVALPSYGQNWGVKWAPVPPFYDLLEKTARHDHFPDVRLHVVPLAWAALGVCSAAIWLFARRFQGLAAYGPASFVAVFLFWGTAVALPAVGHWASSNSRIPARFSQIQRVTILNNFGSKWSGNTGDLVQIGAQNQNASPLSRFRIRMEAEDYCRESCSVIKDSAASGGWGIKAESPAGKRVVAVWGQYVPLPKGKYEAAFSFGAVELEKGGAALVEIVQNSEKILASRPLDESPHHPMVRIPFQVTEPSTIEFTLVLDGSRVTLDFADLRIFARQDLGRPPETGHITSSR